MRFIPNPFSQEAREERRKIQERYKDVKFQGKLSRKDFWALVFAQYTVIFPVFIIFNLIIFLFLLFAKYVWWRV